MALYFSTTLRNLRLEAIRTAVGSGGKIKLYSGTQPGANGTATTLLGTLVCAGAFGSAASAGVVTITGFASDTDADATGSATWARLTKSDDTWVADLTVGPTGSGAHLTMNSTAVELHGTIAPGTITITEANA